MKVRIKQTKASSIFWEGKFYDTNKDIELPFSDAYRLSRIAAMDAEFEAVPYNPKLWQDGKFINFFGDIDSQSGFGNVSFYLIREAAPKIEIASMGKAFNVRNPVILAAQKRPLRQDGVMVWHDQPRDSWLYSPFKKNIAIIPWETTVIPKSWIARINAFDALFVPCKQNIVDFRNSGVTVPIELIHWGVDPAVFHEISRPQRDTFTFGSMGALSIRKGTDLLIAAFREAFPTEQDVRLICKTSYNTYPFDVKDKRISVHLTSWTAEELMTQFFEKIDCFVFPTRGEGFGLTPLEAMATGVPAIVTGWSGPLEYMTAETGWLIDHTMAPAKNFTDSIYKEECGDWAEPSKDHLVKLMRYAYEHRDETRAKGLAAAEHVRQNWLWSDKINMYIQALEKTLNDPDKVGMV